MTKGEKNLIIDNLTQKVNENAHVYLTDISGLNAGDTHALRSACFKDDIELIVAKNTLLKKAFEQSDKELDGVYSALKGSTSIMFSQTGNVPAKLIKEFRKTNDKPVLKAAYVEEGVYLGEESLADLVSIKSREELIGDVIGLLQSPAKNVISALQSGQGTLHGVLETLSKK